MTEMHKKLLDDFHARLITDFDHYFEHHGNAAKPLDEFITFLIDHSLIDKQTIRRYTVLREFKRVRDCKKNKTTLVKELASKYNISERSVWSVLKGGEGLFYRVDIASES